MGASELQAAAWMLSPDEAQSVRHTPAVMSRLQSKKCTLLVERRWCKGGVRCGTLLASRITGICRCAQTISKTTWHEGAAPLRLLDLMPPSGWSLNGHVMNDALNSPLQEYGSSSASIFITDWRVLLIPVWFCPWWDCAKCPVDEKLLFRQEERTTALAGIFLPPGRAHWFDFYYTIKLLHFYNAMPA